MITDITALFESERGKRIYDNVTSQIKEWGMDKLISGGVLVGFSGGADSVMLLSLLKKYSEDFGNFKLLAVHINHMIRGEEAASDEEFSRAFCESLGVEFIAKSYDVPSIARESSKGLEEAARDVRYSAFREIIQGRNDIECVAVAHNSTDNLETLIFNMTRGAGTRGMSGIAPVRENIIRPLIDVAKADIVSALDSVGVPFVVDSTNLTTDYNRNFIRHEILPKLLHLTKKPEAMAARMSKNLRVDDDFISGVALDFLSEYGEGKIPHAKLSSLHFAVFSRVISHLAKSASGASLESVHITQIYELLKSGESFSVSLPGGISFFTDGAVTEILPGGKKEKASFFKRLKLGVNEIPEISADIILSNEKIDNSSVKIYKNAIQQTIPFDIIEGELFARERREGDSYVFGKMTRKVKKLFNDRKIPKAEREKTPIICDGSGILWLPGFPHRDSDVRCDKKLYLLVGYKE